MTGEHQKRNKWEVFFRGRSLKVIAPYSRIQVGDIFWFINHGHVLVTRKKGLKIATLERSELLGNITSRKWKFYEESSRTEGYPLLYNFQTDDFNKDRNKYAQLDRLLAEAGL
jgi:hypothetical protein